MLAAAYDSRDELTCEVDESDEQLRAVVLVPAHNEEVGIERTLESIRLAVYPQDRMRVIVIADNCTDGTVEAVRRSGVEVWERSDTSKRGKGFALAWAIDRLIDREDAFDMVVILDADCVISANLLAAVSSRLSDGAEAIQTNYVADNPGDSHAASLRYAAFALMNTVRFLGKQRLGLSCGLVGTGMAFTRELLMREPWTTTGLVEDGEYHMRLVLSGGRTEFVANATVSSPVPTTLRSGADQQARWEQGKLQIIRAWVPRLLRVGVARRDVVAAHAGVEYLIPPQSIIAAAAFFLLPIGVVLNSRRTVTVAVASGVAQGGYVLGGLGLVGAPTGVYVALLTAPSLVARKLWLYAKLLTGRGPKAWIRTEREAIAGVELTHGAVGARLDESRIGPVTS